MEAKRSAIIWARRPSPSLKLSLFFQSFMSSLRISGVRVSSYLALKESWTSSVDVGLHLLSSYSWIRKTVVLSACKGKRWRRSGVRDSLSRAKESWSLFLQWATISSKDLPASVNSWELLTEGFWPFFSKESLWGRFSLSCWRELKRFFGRFFGRISFTPWGPFLSKHHWNLH